MGKASALCPPCKFGPINMIESDYHDMILLLTAEGSRPMETVDLSTNAFKLPRNLRCLCIGPSESGKSTWISNLIKNKDKLFHSPGYAKFIFCSPNIAQCSGFSKFFRENFQPLNFLIYQSWKTRVGKSLKSSWTSCRTVNLKTVRKTVIPHCEKI